MNRKIKRGTKWKRREEKGSPEHNIGDQRRAYQHNAVPNREESREEYPGGGSGAKVTQKKKAEEHAGSV